MIVINVTSDMVAMLTGKGAISSFTLQLGGFFITGETSKPHSEK